MKRLFCIIAITAASLTCFGCGGEKHLDTDATTGASIPEEGQGQGTVEDAGKALVVFFSRAGENYNVGVVSKGNTAFIAEYIISLTGADSFEIVPVIPYTDNYKEMTELATKEKNEKARPAIKDLPESIDAYDTVFIGGPVWWGEPPMILHTFIEAYPSLGDKTLIPFGTHEGSGVNNYTTMLKTQFPQARIMKVFGLRGTEARKDEAKASVESWLEEIGIIREED